MRDTEFSCLVGISVHINSIDKNKQMNTITKSSIIFFIVLITLKTVKGQDSIMVKLPDTGQSKSYSAIFGEDADYSINVPSYTDKGDGTIKDNVTKLIWQKADGGEMTWEMSQDYCSKLDLAGYSWRLPRSHELFGILNQGLLPAIDKNIFTYTDAEYWWTGQTDISDNSKVWVTNSGGGIGPHPKIETISAGGTRRFHTRCVKDESWQQKYIDNNNGTITDSKTGLCWQKEPGATTKTWFEALSYAENLDFAGYKDWRLPNIKELQSISETNFSNPSVDPIFFPSTNPGIYWSSTSMVSKDTTQAWNVDFSFGIASYAIKTGSHFVRCVRGVGSTTNIDHIAAKDFQVKMFPNPVNNGPVFLDVSLGENIPDNFTVEVYDLTRHKVSSSLKNFSVDKECTFGLQFENLLPGIYLVGFLAKNLTCYSKLIVL
jgi:hypothetical protein